MTYTSDGGESCLEEIGDDSEEIRVLVVDDSAVVRSIIADSIAATPGMKVVGTAGDGRQALEILDSPEAGRDHAGHPDAQYGRAGDAGRDPGAAARPGDHGQLADQAGGEHHAGRAGSRRDRLPGETRLRGQDPIRTPGGVAAQNPHRCRLDVQRILEIRRNQAAKQRVAGRGGSVGAKPAALRKTGRRSPARCELADKCIAIGISTGGPPALACLFESLRPPMPPIVVVQHMPASFTKPLAWRLDSLGELSIREAASGDLLEPNHVLIAPGGKHLQVRRVGTSVKAVVRDGPW